MGGRTSSLKVTFSYSYGCWFPKIIGSVMVSDRWLSHSRFSCSLDPQLRETGRDPNVASSYFAMPHLKTMDLIHSNERIIHTAQQIGADNSGQSRVSTI